MEQKIKILKLEIKKLELEIELLKEKRKQTVTVSNAYYDPAKDPIASSFDPGFAKPINSNPNIHTDKTVVNY